MFSSLSALSSSASISTNSGSAASATRKIFRAARSQGFEKKIPLASKDEVEKKLASILTQIQQNQIIHLNLTSVSLGRFYELTNTLSGHKEAVYSLAVLKNGATASGSGSPENAIKIWDMDSHACLFTLYGHTDSVYALAALPNGQLASGSHDSTIKLWDLSLHSCLSTLQGHIGPIYALTVLPNGLLASGSSDNTIKLWSLASRSCLSTLRGHASAILALAALPNGLLASSSLDATIKLWSLASNSCLSTLQGHAGAVYALAFIPILPNGLIASGSLDTTIKLWGLASRSCLSTLQGHTSFVFALAVLPNDLLASSSADHTIKIWDLASHSCLSTLQGHTSSVYALAALPNGLLASDSSDHIIKLWESKTLSAKQLSALLNALKNNTSVMNLDVSGNRDIVDDLMNPLMSVFTSDTSSSLKPNTFLKTIDLRKTGVSQKGVKNLEKIIQSQRLSVEVLTDCPMEWMMIYFLIIFSRANRNSPFVDSCLDLCKHGEMGSFLGVPPGFFSRSRKDHSSNSKRMASPQVKLTANS